MVAHNRHSSVRSNRPTVSIVDDDDDNPFVAEPDNSDDDDDDCLRRAASIEKADSLTLSRLRIPAGDKVSRAAYLHRAIGLSEEPSQPIEFDLNTEEIEAWLQRLDEHLYLRRRLVRDHRHYMGRMTRWTFWVLRSRLLLVLQRKRRSAAPGFFTDPLYYGKVPKRSELAGEHGALLRRTLLECGATSMFLPVSTSVWLRCATRLSEVSRHLGVDAALNELRNACDALELLAARLSLGLRDRTLNDHAMYASGDHRAFLTFVRDAELLIGAIRDTYERRARLQLPVVEVELSSDGTVTRNVWRWAIEVSQEQMLADDVSRAFKRRMHACFVRADERERFECEQRMVRASATNVLGMYRQHTLERANAWHTDHDDTPVKDVLSALLSSSSWFTQLLFRGDEIDVRDQVDGFERLAMDVVLRYYFSVETRLDAMDRFMIDEGRVSFEFNANPHLPRIVRLHNAYEVVSARGIVRARFASSVDCRERNSLALAFAVWLHVMCMEHDGMVTERHHVWDLYEKLVPCTGDDRMIRDRRRSESEERVFLQEHNL